MTTQRALTAAGRRLYRLLEEHTLRIVFAESCTGGLVAATMARFPGVSNYLCGSAVVYQLETKTAWLGIPSRTLAADDAVTGTVADQMARAVLRNTPQADVAAAVTGHLGPGAPRSLDGLVYVAVARRGSARQRGSVTVQVDRHRLPRGTAGRAGSAGAARTERQRAAALLVLRAVCHALAKPAD